MGSAIREKETQRDLGVWLRLANHGETYWKKFIRGKQSFSVVFARYFGWLFTRFTGKLLFCGNKWLFIGRCVSCSMSTVDNWVRELNWNFVLVSNVCIKNPNVVTEFVTLFYEILPMQIFSGVLQNAKFLKNVLG